MFYWFYKTKLQQSPTFVYRSNNLNTLNPHIDNIHNRGIFRFKPILSTSISKFIRILVALALN